MRSLPPLRTALIGLLLILILAEAGCGAAGCRVLRASGPAGENCLVRTELFFGLSRPGGAITEADWQGFVETYITPLFQEGLTIINAEGQWLDRRGLVMKENSKLLILLYTPDQKKDEAVDFIRAKYKELFRQESVLKIRGLAEVSF
ncbi:MAG: DUF3574 domain-containing protein [Thermodesulfobacteriota bacterium]